MDDDNTIAVTEDEISRIYRHIAYADRHVDPGQGFLHRMGRTQRSCIYRKLQGTDILRITAAAVDDHTGNILQHYLHTPGRWAVAPMSVIQAIQGDDLVFYRLKESPPPRICYQITSRYPNFAHVQAIEQFNKAMEDFIKEDGSICLFEEWMLEEQQKYR